MLHKPFNGLTKQEYLSLTKPAAVNYAIQEDGTAVLDIDGYIGRDIIREWMTGEDSPNTVKNIKSALREISAEKIIVNINSPGGDLNAGLVIMNMLQSKKADIVTNIMGFSASAATVIAQAGSTRRMAKTSFQLLHRVMFGICGYLNQNTFKDLAADCQTIDSQLIKMYESKSSMSEDEITALMDEGGGYGKWISADDALEYGLIDEVYDPENEEDENTDHLEAMQNVQKLASNGVGMDDIMQELDKAIKKSKKELSSSASARPQHKNRAKTLKHKII